MRPSLEWSAQGQNLSPQDIENMRHWNANVIRLDLYQNYWFASEPATQKGSYKQIINAIIYYAIQNKMAVILDLHWTDGAYQSPMANANSVTFWKQVANDYKNFGTVIFELFNEPYGFDPNNKSDLDRWLNGDKISPGYQQLYDAVRSVGANNICIINGTDYGYDISFVNDAFGVKGYNIVYGSHPYNEKGANGGFDKNFKGVLGKYPLIFTEFGVNQSEYFPDGYKKVYDRILAYINANKVSYTAFAWWVDSMNPNTFPDLIKDWSGTPLNGGTNVHNDMQGHPAIPIDS